MNKCMNIQEVGIYLLYSSLCPLLEDIRILISLNFCFYFQWHDSHSCTKGKKLIQGIVWIIASGCLFYYQTSHLPAPISLCHQREMETRLSEWSTDSQLQDLQGLPFQRSLDSDRQNTCCWKGFVYSGSTRIITSCRPFKICRQRVELTEKLKLVFDKGALDLTLKESSL